MKLKLPSKLLFFVVFLLIISGAKAQKNDSAPCVEKDLKDLFGKKGSEPAPDKDHVVAN